MMTVLQVDVRKVPLRNSRKYLVSSSGESQSDSVHHILASNWLSMSPNFDPVKIGEHENFFSKSPIVLAIAMETTVSNPALPKVSELFGG